MVLPITLNHNTTAGLLSAKKKGPGGGKELGKCRKVLKGLGKGVRWGGISKGPEPQNSLS